MIDHPKAWLLTKCRGLLTILPVLKVSAYVFDFAKEVTLVGLSVSVEFLVVGGSPAILTHLLGCLFLALYYSCSHTWREIMGKEREEEGGCRMQISLQDLQPAGFFCHREAFLGTGGSSFSIFTILLPG